VVNLELVGWSVGWSAVWLDSWSVGRLVGWLVKCVCHQCIIFKDVCPRFLLRFGLRYVYSIRPLVNCQLGVSLIFSTADNYDSFRVHI
jgi:hypothetical protein